MTKRLVFNNDFIKNADDKFIDEFTSVSDGIPILIMNAFPENVYDLRVSKYIQNPSLEKEDNREIEITRKLIKEDKTKEAEEFQIQYAVDFLNKYSQFKPVLKRVETVKFTDLKILLNNIREAFFGELDPF